MSERTKAIDIKGWSFTTTEAMRFSGPEVSALGGSPHQVVLRLDHMDAHEMYDLARQLQRFSDRLERLALRLIEGEDDSTAPLF